jgi:hypothetical protein
MKPKIYPLLFLFLLNGISAIQAYPIDGYLLTGIRRLLYLQLVEKEELKGRKLISGATKSIEDIQLNLLTCQGAMMQKIPEIDPFLQKELNSLFPYMHESYAVSLLDITPGKPVRYAQRKSDHQFQPGSVGKLAVITGLFAELEKIYPDCFEARRELLKTKMVRAGKWAIYDEHTIPIFDTLTQKLHKRQVRESDFFSLYEWADHMMSVSNNGAAAVLWREVILMRVYGINYPTICEESTATYFKDTPRSELSELAISVVNEPLRTLGIAHEEWRLGTMFTRGATSYIPRKGGSTGTPKALMKWMMALERGNIIDPESSLEIKRLMYMTGTRIRYASSSSLKEAAVYFKSGSLYSCNRELAPDCGKYRGNVKNYMNSVAIIERPDSTTYMIALMSNVLNKNSSADHYALARKIDAIVRKEAENK